MPQDPNLYGQRPAKKKKTGELDLSNTLGFAAQLQSIISSKSTSSTSSSSRPGTLSASFKKRPREEEAETTSKPRSKSTKGKANWIKGPAQPAGNTPLDEHERERIRKSMASKARRYAAMQRGDYVSKEGDASSLVDFDRKWAEKNRREQSANDNDRDNRGDRDNRDSRDSSNSDDNDDSSDEYSGSDFEADRTTMVEHVDEYGRTRTISKAERDRDLRRKARAARAAQDLDEMSARPAPPTESRIIYGDIIQTGAIETAMDHIGKMPAKREDGEDDVADTHYRAGDDVRTRGAAFYAFATNDEAKRSAQMKALAEERAKTETARSQTEKARSERSAQLEARRQEMAARRATLEEKKAKKQADSFLDGLGQDFLGE
ncbi:hypothetical protein F503_01986 [Ophiostoma piceae UAMH 11346]|uniref:Uncharacterized protein n=1 Tax=Ophiostoma piceae (strain UAMH 11346) TaxID=1262450 RepID=S3CAK2_OPHP1|nr:hypothetical protein F503_01986 [Ophiostoma piceae UAMH 11346]